MVNIEESLAGLFSFQRSSTDSYQVMDRLYKNQVKSFTTNVLVEDKSRGVYGIAQSLYAGSKGLVIHEYAMDRKINRTGPALKAPFDSLQDCEFYYYALRLNVLACMHGGMVDSLTIRDVYNNDSIPVRYNPSMAERFLNEALVLTGRYYRDAPAPVVPIETQHSLFI